MLDQLKQQLATAVEDATLNREEKAELQNMVQTLDTEQCSFLRNRAFDMARDQILSSSDNNQHRATLKWLEQVIKITQQLSPNTVSNSAYFSPGDECRNALVNLCRNAQRSIDICVYTISDDRLSDAIIAAHQRSVAVRVISDNHKSEDAGSDIDYLISKDIPLRMDHSQYHMHHKFALFDHHWLANGSFNWTRSASKVNEENVVVSNDPALVRVFIQQFESLWKAYR